ncbi:hypothetical protein IQ269_14545 [Tychonema sp. LEGE 07199]|nr:hypothetical protein [Tychonema sp. LEGE 07199]MBE9132100.1 hypothetical protein [Tychonema sp. LEGE 07196]
MSVAIGQQSTANSQQSTVNSKQTKNHDLLSPARFANQTRRPDRL